MNVGEEDTEGNADDHDDDDDDDGEQLQQEDAFEPGLVLLIHALRSHCTRCCRHSCTGKHDSGDGENSAKSGTCDDGAGDCTEGLGGDDEDRTDTESGIGCGDEIDDDGNAIAEARTAAAHERAERAEAGAGGVHSTSKNLGGAGA